jgi:hypothetical protein
MSAHLRAGRAPILLCGLCACGPHKQEEDAWQAFAAADLFLAGTATAEGDAVRLVGGFGEAGAAWAGTTGALDVAHLVTADAVEARAQVRLRNPAGADNAGDGFTLTFLDVARAERFVGADGEAMGAGADLTDDGALEVPGLPGWSVEVDLYSNYALPGQAAGELFEPHVAVFIDGDHRAPIQRAPTGLTPAGLPTTVDLRVRSEPNLLQVWIDGQVSLQVLDWSPPPAQGLVGVTAGTGTAPVIEIDLLNLDLHDPG